MKCIAMLIAAIAAQVCAHAALAPTTRAADAVAAEIAEVSFPQHIAIGGRSLWRAKKRTWTTSMWYWEMIARLTWSYDA
jgi:hypothetical protein